jgi:zeaxanthin glucosyltransferase
MATDAKSDGSDRRPRHIGLICPELSGHLNPLTTLGGELKRRGHRVTVLGRPDGEPKSVRAGLEFVGFGEKDFPKGHQERFTAEIGAMSEFRALRRYLSEMRLHFDVAVRDLPAAVREAGIDALLVDQVEPGPATVAEHLGIPFVTVCNALPIYPDPLAPPWNSTWPLPSGLWGRWRNRMGNWANEMATSGVNRHLHRIREGLKLPRRRVVYEGSPLAHVAQLPACFDFPRESQLSRFHYTGPWYHPKNMDDSGFPYDRLDERPLIYASMGTLQNRQPHGFRCIAEAVSGLNAQVIISFGRKDAEVGGDWPDNVLAVPFAPQLELLQRAQMVITHAGMNTTLEAISHGRRLVAIPVAYDQRGVAARIRHFGVGEVVPLARLTTERLRSAVEQVWNDSSYGENARRLGESLQGTNGAEQAADIIERALG